MDDVVYQVWDYVLNTLPDFQYDPAKGRFRSWLFRIVRSKTIDAVRRTAVARKAVVGQQDTDFWHNVVDPDGRTPDDEWELAWAEEAGRIVWERYQQEVRDATQTRNSQSRAGSCTSSKAAFGTAVLRRLSPQNWESRPTMPANSRNAVSCGFA